jgi:hypothetical protein
LTKPKPPIDKAAEIAHPTQGAVPPMPPALDDPETSLADVAENHPGYRYRPQKGVVSSDVMEVTIMLLLQLFAPHIDVQPGALRQQIMEAERFGRLSPEAQRHMMPVVQEMPTE